MVRAGAVGETRTQIDTVLHAASAADLDSGLNAIDQALAKRSDQAWERIREALRLFDIEHVELSEQVSLPRSLLESVRRARRARAVAEARRRDAQTELRAAAARFARAGLSRRDAGDLLGVSRQRVQQLRTG